MEDVKRQVTLFGNEKKILHMSFLTVSELLLKVYNESVEY